MERLASRAFSNFVSQVEQSEIWTFVTSAVSNSVQATSNDNLADSKLKRAMDILKDDRLPNFKAAENKENYVIDNFIGFLDSSFTESLEESLELVAEACQMWSTMQAEEQANSVKDCFAELAKKIRLCDDSMSILAAAAFDDVLVDLKAEGWPADVVLGDVVAAVGRCSFESGAESLAEKLFKTIEKLPTVILSSIGGIDFGEKISKDVARTGKVRNLLQQTMQLLGTVGPPQKRLTRLCLCGRRPRTLARRRAPSCSTQFLA